jgi:hypothetical protein
LIPFPVRSWQIDPRWRSTIFRQIASPSRAFERGFPVSRWNGWKNARMLHLKSDPLSST